MPPKQKTKPAINLIAGGTAGLCEALCCHPLDTIKVRMQLSTLTVADGIKRVGFFATFINIVRKESVFCLYKGLGAVITGIVPKMAIRFSSFEFFQGAFVNKSTNQTNPTGIFFAGLAAGTTEALLVVNPTDLIEIRLQAQSHAMAGTLEVPKYRNAAQAALTIVREEGLSALYRGVILTALRQATNQAVNFTAYSEIKAHLKTLQPQYEELPMQKEISIAGESALVRGFFAFYMGITPRVMRVAPGQAVTFAVYEQVSKLHF
ncbi:mitochondrial carrier domain-containing protein [Lipomyces starkeyi]